MARKLHSVLQGDVPAKDTLIKFKEQEEKICKLKEKDQNFALTVQSMEDKLTSIEEKVDGLAGKLDGFVSSADDKYASILVQKIVFGAISVVLGMFVVGMVIAAAYFIIRKEL